MKTNQDYIIKYIFGAKTKSRVKTMSIQHYGSKVVPRSYRPYIYGVFLYFGGKNEQLFGRLESCFRAYKNIIY